MSITDLAILYLVPGKTVSVPVDTLYVARLRHQLNTVVDPPPGLLPHLMTPRELGNSSPPLMLASTFLTLQRYGAPALLRGVADVGTSDQPRVSNKATKGQRGAGVA
jgi:hypothetical protein